jgi:hypothetical protein
MDNTECSLETIFLREALMIRGVWFVTLAFFCAATTRSSGPAQPAELQIIQDAMTLVSQGKSLAAIHSIESKMLPPEFAMQALPTLYSLVGDVPQLVQLKSRLPAQSVVELPSDAKLDPALEAIAGMARGRQRMIVNEAYDCPAHRLFISQLAKQLWEDGFQYYAFEALGEDARQLSARGYPAIATGFYSNEPMFGQPVRDTLALGYTMVAYEDTSSSHFDDPIDAINSREAAQCDNLVERVFSRDPDARVLVHVGHDHAMEAPVDASDKSIRWLAMRRKESTGIDPLTIDQTTLLHASYGWPVDLEQPMVVSQADGRLVVGGHFADAVDIQVYHPQPQTRNGRPDWLFRDPLRHSAPIPREIAEDSRGLLLQAFHADERMDAVPADQFILPTDDTLPPFLLRPGAYRTMTQDREGVITLRAQEFTVRSAQP